MALETLHNKIEETKYADELEKTLGVSDIINQLEIEFNIFLQEEEKNKHIGFHPQDIEEKDSELKLLKFIKLFLHRKKDDIKNITQKSPLSNKDCLTLATIACLLANKKGYQVKIGRPDKLSRYFHALVVKKNGEMFKVTGHNRNYDIKVMEVKEVLSRLKTMKPIMDFAASFKDLF